MRKHLLLIILLTTCCTPLFAQRDVPPTTAFTITGAVKNERTFTIAQLLQMHQDAIGDVALTNHKGDPKSNLKQLKGVLLKTLLDSATITAAKPKEYSELVITLIASDGYRNVYSWNEIFNTEVGNHVYIITSMDGNNMDQVPGRILVLSLSDIVSGRRHLKGLEKIEIKKVP